MQLTVSSVAVYDAFNIVFPIDFVELLNEGCELLRLHHHILNEGCGAPAFTSKLHYVGKGFFAESPELFSSRRVVGEPSLQHKPTLLHNNIVESLQTLLHIFTLRSVVLNQQEGLSVFSDIFPELRMCA